MRAVMLTNKGFELGEMEISKPGKNELLIKTISCGVCGGDHFVFQTREQSSENQQMLGHEGSGIVVEVGSGVRGFKVGDKVTALGGAYADYFLVSPDKLVKIPETIDPIFALGEPIACCVHASERFGIREGDKVAVVGCGFMGLICLQLAKHQGAGKITALDLLKYRRDMALKLGAFEAFEPAELTIDDPWLGDFDVVIEASGAQPALDLCGELVKQHGRIILIGYHESNAGMRLVNLKLWNFKAIDVVNGHVRREDEKQKAMAKGIELLEKGHLTTEPLVHQYALDDVSQAFEDFGAGKEGLFKAVLVPQADGREAGKEK